MQATRLAKIKRDTFSSYFDGTQPFFNAGISDAERRRVYPTARMRLNIRCRIFGTDGPIMQPVRIRPHITGERTGKSSRVNASLGAIAGAKEDHVVRQVPSPSGIACSARA